MNAPAATVTPEVASLPQQRTALSRSLRFQVLRRDNHTCRYCGRSAPEWPMRVDHVIPVALGGRGEPENLVTACADCNAGKAAMPPDAALVADVEADALRWASAMERATQLQRIEADVMRDLQDEFADYWTEVATNSCKVDPNWRESIAAFFKAGLVENDLRDATDIAARNRRIGRAAVWRYFCGVCWKRIEQRRELAAQLVGQEDDADVDPMGEAL